jgi:hypothetical protein
MEDRQTIVNTARRILLQRLESLHRAGIQQLPRRIGVSPVQNTLLRLGERAERSKSGEGAVDSLPVPTTPLNPEPRAPSPLPPPSMPSLTAPYPTNLPTSLADRQNLLETLSTEVRSCTSAATSPAPESKPSSASAAPSPASFSLAKLPAPVKTAKASPSSAAQANY